MHNARLFGIALLAVLSISPSPETSPETRRPEREPLALEDLGRQFEQVAKSAAPYTEVAEGAQENARQQRDKMSKRTGAWKQVGTAPLYANDAATASRQSTCAATRPTSATAGLAAERASTALAAASPPTWVARCRRSG